MPVKDSPGTTVRDHYKQAEKSGNRVPELHCKPPHPLVEHVWFYFAELHRGRSRGFGPGPIPYEAIYWWQKLRGIELLPYELDLILAIDNDYLDAESKRMAAEQG